jgi:hypothetical protein
MASIMRRTVTGQGSQSSYVAILSSPLLVSVLALRAPHPPDAAAHDLGSLGDHLIQAGLAAFDAQVQHGETAQFGFRCFPEPRSPQAERLKGWPTVVANTVALLCT